MRFKCVRCAYEVTTFGNKAFKHRINEAFFEDIYCSVCYAPMELCEVCKTRIARVGNTWSTVCEGCPEYFNCLSGNVDDGSAPKAKDPSPTLAEKIKKLQIERRGDKLRYYGHLLVGYFEIHKAEMIKDSPVIAVTLNRSTKLKLENLDIDSIISGRWDTLKTKLIYHTLKKYSVDTSIVSDYIIELLARKHE